MDREVVYSVPDSTAVLVNSETGEFHLTQELDGEMSDVLVLVITATDNPSNMAQAWATTVQVTLNANDNWPVCSRTVYHIYTSPDIEPPSVIFGCVDADIIIGSNAQLSYSLGDASDKFSIHSSTGELRLTGALSQENTVTYHVPVVVQVRATPLSITLLKVLQGPADLTEQEYTSLWWRQEGGKMLSVSHSGISLDH